MCAGVSPILIWSPALFQVSALQGSASSGAPRILYQPHAKVSDYDCDLSAPLQVKDVPCSDWLGGLPVSGRELI